MAVEKKQPLKKKTADDFKNATQSERLSVLNTFKSKENLDMVRKKPQQWLILPKAFEDATDVVGIPLGTVSCSKGHTNSGKTSIMLEVIKACMRQNILPVVFDLENAMKWHHAKEVGMEVGEYVNEDTGEIELGPPDFMIYYDTTTLYEKYGLYDHSQSKYVTKPQRDNCVIEDVAMCIRELITKQRADEIPFDLMFIIDSIGCGDCFKGAMSKSSNQMWFAGALSTSFNVIGNDLIPSSMNVNSKYTNSMFYVNKVWNSSTPSGIVVAKEKGGSSFTYFTRFSIFLGGQASSGIKRLSFAYKEKNYEYGSMVKIRIDKNHITNIQHDGEICNTAKGIVSVNDIENYKDEYKKYLIQELKVKTGTEIREKDLIEKEELTDD